MYLLALYVIFMEISIAGGGRRGFFFFFLRTGSCSSNFPVVASRMFLWEAVLSDHNNGTCLMYLLLAYVYILRINMRTK